MQNTRRSLFLLLGGTFCAALFAQTEPAPASVVGKWQFVFQTESEPRTFNADFKLDGKAVTGTWDKQEVVKGTFSEGKLDLEFQVNSEEVGPGTLKLTGKVTDVITGSWSFQSYEGTFKATRIKS